MNIAKKEFIEAMRVRLEAKQSGLGKNVDLPDVQDNLGALGQAVYRIATVFAETRSDATTDSAFWQWVGQVNDWLADLRAWQQGVADAFATWVPENSSEQQLKKAIQTVPDPGAPPALAPTKLMGKVE
jgi:hypothetical protein